MKKRKLIILLSIILVVILVGIIYWKFDRCKILSEEDCYNTYGCQGRYGPSSCNDGNCTSDEKFHGCGSVSKKLLNSIKPDKALCKKTYGKWMTRESSKYNKYSFAPHACNCDDEQNGFAKNIGCVNIISFCEEKGGEWNLGKRYNLHSEINELECNKIEGAIFWRSHEYKPSYCKIYDKNGKHQEVPGCIINGTEEKNKYTILGW
jgi:hypothetical protein